MDIRDGEPRQTASWSGRYWFEDDPRIAEGPCRIIDISADGAGVELFGDAPIEPTGRRLTISLEGTIDGTAIAICINGLVRYVILGDAGGVRVGINFSDVSNRQYETLKMLERIRSSG